MYPTHPVRGQGGARFLHDHDRQHPRSREDSWCGPSYCAVCRRHGTSVGERLLPSEADAWAGESTNAWADFLSDLVDRGLACPLLVISDGAKGLIAAIEQVFPAALRQRCLIHRPRNVLAKTPARVQAEIRDGYWKIFDTEDLTTEPGPRLVKLIDHRLTEFADRYAATYPAAMKILLSDREGLTAYLRFPYLRFPTPSTGAASGTPT